MSRKVVVCFDHREKDLYSCVSSKSHTDTLTLRTEPLAVGDVVICDAADQNALVIIERKTLADLSASIRDGRYKEQSHRLGGCGVPKHNVLFLVEGVIDEYQRGVHGLGKTVLESALFALWYHEGFSVHHTTCLSGSADYILLLAEKLSKQRETAITSPCSYASVCKKTKSSQVTTENIFSIMLSQIPGVSAAVATAVDARYPGLYNLIETLRGDPNALDDLGVQTKTGKKRKINRSAISNLKKYLLV